MTREKAIVLIERAANELREMMKTITMPTSAAEQLQQEIDAHEIAISALRQQEHFREVTKKVEPLTLDELRQMDGEPAWFVSMRDGFASWGIVRVVDMSKAWFIAVAGAERAFGDIDGYGKTWLAFRQKPEEGTV